jgi:hypothetical protein
MSGSNKSFGWMVEAFGPITCGLLSLVILWLLRWSIIPLMVTDTISVGNLFSAVFGWASIQTGCVFAIYGFVAGKNDGFIGEVRRTRSMKRFGIYIRRAITSGFLLTVTSMPLIVWKFAVSPDDKYLFLLIITWFALFVWAFLSFARVAYIFGILIRVNDSEKVGAG